MVSLDMFGSENKNKKENEKELNIDTKYRVYIGDSEQVTKRMVDENIRVDLVVTSPPYFDMRGYVEYDSYKAYLNKMKVIFSNIKKILRGGRMLVVNVGDYLTNGKRLTLGADWIVLLRDIGYYVMDDIIWVKPIGYMNDAGKRAGTFVKNRTPMYFYPNNRYEHIILAINGREMARYNEKVYGKDIYEASKVTDYYFNKYLKNYMSDVWEIMPETNSWHPAPFPIDIPIKFILLYSFVGETVLDPFHGSGTTMRAAAKLNRSAIGIEMVKEYVDKFKKSFWKDVEVVE